MTKLLKLFTLSASLITILASSTAYARNQPLMEQALRDLERAERALEKAARNKGGHRVKALNNVRRAIDHVNRGMEFADQRMRKYPPQRNRDMRRDERMRNERNMRNERDLRRNDRRQAIERERAQQARQQQDRRYNKDEKRKKDEEEEERRSLNFRR